MYCNRCGAQLEESQRFCPRCGRAVAPVAGEALPPPAVYDFAADEPDDITADLVRPAWADFGLAPPPPGSEPVGVATDEVTTVVAPPPVRPDLAERTGATRTVTAQMPVLVVPDADEQRPRFRLGVVAGVSLLTALVTAVGAFANLLRIRTDADDPAFPTGDWTADTLATNLRAAAVVAVGALLIGTIAAGFHQRWGAGLAAGAGLAVVGWTALVIGLVEQPAKIAETAVLAPTTEPYTVTITRDLGYWLVIVAAMLGGLTFLVSLVRAGNDHRRGLNPWIAALGAVAALVAAVGPMLPEGSATFENNWSSAGGTVDQPTAFLVGRLVQLGLLAFSGAIGFLLVRRYGLGLAIGGMTVPVVLAVTTLLGLGTEPIGPALTNPGDDLTSIDLHAVTIVGMTALVGLAIVAVIAAYELAAREP